MILEVIFCGGKFNIGLLAILGDFLNEGLPILYRFTASLVEPKVDYASIPKFDGLGCALLKLFEPFVGFLSVSFYCSFLSFSEEYVNVIFGRLDTLRFVFSLFT